MRIVKIFQRGCTIHHEPSLLVLKAQRDKAISSLIWSHSWLLLAGGWTKWSPEVSFNLNYHRCHWGKTFQLMPYFLLISKAKHFKCKIYLAKLWFLTRFIANRAWFIIRVLKKYNLLVLILLLYKSIKLFGRPLEKIEEVLSAADL